MRRARSLLAIVARRILLFAALAGALQASLIFADYWFDAPTLGRLMIEEETQRVAAAFREAADGGDAFPPPALRGRYGAERTGYLLRVSAPDGRIAFSNCGADCEALFPPLGSAVPDFWERLLSPGKPLHVAGGRLFAGGDAGAPLVVAFATLGDPDGLIFGVIGREMRDHLLVPMGMMLALVIGATILSTRQALAPVATAAAAADRIDPQQDLAPLPTQGMPREIERLALAVNRALDRVRDLVRTQRIFVASVAHEIRTPVAIVKLELGRIDHPRARRAEDDLERLVHTLEQLTALARLELAGEEAFRLAPLADPVRDAVEEIAPLVFASGRTIGFRADAAARPVRLAPALVATLARNLVENAVRHTRPGTTIEVSAEAPAVLVVRDDGGGPPENRASAGSGGMGEASGLGLRIAERIAAFHQARLEIDARPGDGMTVRVAFPASPPP